jgi:hypothetical protein
MTGIWRQTSIKNNGMNQENQEESAITTNESFFNTMPGI